MTGGKKPYGYTIVEVLIFMAVSGLMFVFAIGFINGKQAQVEFRQGLYDVNAEIRTTINEVSDGRFPQNLASSGGHCSVSSPSIPASGPTFSLGAKEQGTNGGTDGCIFLGKVMHFNVTDPGIAEPLKEVRIYTVVGRQLNKDEIPVTSFAEAVPKPATGVYDLTESKQLQAGLEATHAYLCSNADCSGFAPEVGLFGFFGSFNPAQSIGSSAGIQSGSQSVVAATIPLAATFGLTKAEAVTAIPAAKGIGSPQILAGGKYVLLCFRNGTKNGSISIGGVNGQAFTTEVKTSGSASKCSS